MRTIARAVLTGALLGLLVPHASAIDPAQRETPLGAVEIHDAFWTPRLDLYRTVTVNDVLDKLVRDGVLDNFDAVRDGVDAEHKALPWFDGLLYEAIAGASDMLRSNPDPALGAKLSGIIDHIVDAGAQDPDGYLNTYTQLEEPDHRWGTNGGNDRWQHDLYNAGCMIEAGVRYARATGDTRLLEASARLANHMCDVMGPSPRQNIIPGHALPESAMLELRAYFLEHPDAMVSMPFDVDVSRYLELARFWVHARGNHEGRASYGGYNQDDRPIEEQAVIQGHAVRATLLAETVASLGSLTDDPSYHATASRWWENMTDKRMYLTGGVGAVAEDERFGDNYQLPNDGYLETCASVGSAMFHHRMNLELGDAKYADELERVLYNGVLAGISTEGTHYCYVNPLNAGPGHTRWAWHSCPCCPPMFLKIMGKLPTLIYTASDHEIGVNLYIGSTLKTEVGTTPLTLTQSTDYPWEGDVEISIEPEATATFTLKLRVPWWCERSPSASDLYDIEGLPPSGAYTVLLNGEPVKTTDEDGYASIERSWHAGDTVAIHMDMPARRVRANERVEADRGRVAITRGPIVYTFESVDNPGNPQSFWLPKDAGLSLEHDAARLGGIDVIHTTGESWAAARDGAAPVPLEAIPYFASNNRGPAHRAVWIPERSTLASRPTLASNATPSSSHTNPSDSLEALSDGAQPASSDDETMPRFTWWDHRGTTEWVQYTFDEPTVVSGSAVYWWDESRLGRHCRVPASWKLEYRTASGAWQEVSDPSGYGTQIDTFNTTRFTPVETTAIRLVADFQDNWSAGILEWNVTGKAEAN